VGSADKLAPTGVLKHFRAFSLCSVERQGRSMPSALDELGSSMLDSVSVLFTDGIRRLALDDDCAGTETTNKDKGGCSTKDHTVPPPSKPAHRHEDKKQGSAAVLTAAGASASKQGPRRGHRRNYSGSWGQFVGFDEDGNLEPVPRSKGQGSRGFASRRYRYNPRSKSAQVVAGGARSTDQDAQSAQDDDSVGVKTWRNLRRAVFRSFLACSFAPTFDTTDDAPRCMHCRAELSVDEASSHWCNLVRPARGTIDDMDRGMHQLDQSSHSETETDTSEHESESIVTQPSTPEQSPREPARPATAAEDPWAALARDRLLVLDGSSSSVTVPSSPAPSDSSSAHSPLYGRSAVQGQCKSQSRNDSSHARKDSACSNGSPAHTPLRRRSSSQSLLDATGPSASAARRSTIDIPPSQRELDPWNALMRDRELLTAAGGRPTVLPSPAPQPGVSRVRCNSDPSGPPRAPKSSIIQRRTDDLNDVLFYCHLE